MNVLIVILLVVLISVVVVIGMLAWSMFKHIKKILKTPTESVWPAPLQAQLEKTQMMGNELKEMNERMRERYSQEKDAELAAYAQMRRNKQMIPNPLPTMMGDDRIHQTNPKAEKILIPEGLSEEERAVVKEFFDL